MDKELQTELGKLNQKESNEIEPLMEHSFIASCLKIGLTLNDLKELEYKDVAKIMLCYAERKKDKKATQKDIDRLLS